MKHCYLFFYLMTFCSYINYTPLLADDTNQSNNIQLTTSDRIQAEVDVLSEKICDLLRQGYSVNAVMAILASDPESYGVVEKMVRNICEILDRANLDPRASNMMPGNIIINNEFGNEQAEEFYARKNFKAKAKIVAAILGIVVSSFLLYKLCQKLFDLFEGFNPSPDRGGASGLPGTDHIPQNPSDDHVQQNNFGNNDIGNRQEAQPEVFQQPHNRANAPMDFAPAVHGDNILFYYEPMIDEELERNLIAEVQKNRDIFQD